VTLAAALAAADAGRDAALARLFESIRIRSASTDPARAGDCRRAAERRAADLSALGFDAPVRPTARHPALGAHPGPACGGKR
jgi:acetylornithine deacetylase/succinyl-diaminopimelate desuccinylase-like protein